MKKETQKAEKIFREYFFWRRTWKQDPPRKKPIIYYYKAKFPGLYEFVKHDTKLDPAKLNPTFS